MNQNWHHGYEQTAAGVRLTLARPFAEGSLGIHAFLPNEVLTNTLQDGIRRLTVAHCWRELRKKLRAEAHPWERIAKNANLDAKIKLAFAAKYEANGNGRLIW
jgi:hypothetical protein